MKLLLKKRNLFDCLLFTFSLILGCEGKLENRSNNMVTHLPYYKDASFTPYWIVPDSDEEKEFHKIPDYKLINQNGDTITQETFKNKIYVTDFFFTSCPGICPQMTDNMWQLQDHFSDDSEILLLSHSVTPVKDSVPALKLYADRNKIEHNKWHLVTGDRAEIYDLGRNHYFVENDVNEPKNIDDFLHTENFLLIDKNKHIRGIYNGLNRASIAQLIEDIKILKREN